MALPNIRNISRGVGDAVGSRAGTLAQSINPSRIIKSGAAAVQGKVLSEMPELGGVASGLTSVLTDIIKGSASSGSTEQIKEKSGEGDVEKTQTTKLTQIQSNTRKTNDTLMEILKFMDYGLYQQLEGDQARLNELRIQSGIEEDAASISQKQLAVLQGSAKADRKDAKDSKFRRQKDTSKVKSAKSLITRKQDGKKTSSIIDFLKFVLPFKLASMFAGVLQPILLAVGGTGAVAMAAKFIPEFAKNTTKVGAIAGGAAIKGFNKAGMPVDVNNKFVKHTPRNMKLAERAERRTLKAAQKAAKPVSKFAKVIKSPITRKVAKGGFKLAKLGMRATPLFYIPMIIDAIAGAFTEGIKSFKAGNTAKKIIADMIFGAGKGVVMGIVETVKFFAMDMPLFLLGILDELWKNMVGDIFAPLGKIYDTFSTQLVDTVKGILTSITDGISNAQTTLDNMINFVVDKTHLSSIISAGEQAILGKPVLEAASKTAPIAANMLIGQKNVSAFEIEQRLRTGEISPTNVVPITSNVSTNNIFTGNIHTRNPESSVAVKHRTSF